MTALKIVRALLVAVFCATTLVVCATTAHAQEAPPVGGDVPVVTDPPPPVDPAPTPTPDPAPTPDPPAEQPVNQPPAEQPADPPPPPPPVDQTPSGERHDTSSSVQRPDSQREQAPQTTPAGPAATVPHDQIAAPAALPPAAPGEDWAWTDQGDAFVMGSGGSGADGAAQAAGSLHRFGSFATAVARVPALGARERAAHDAAQAYATGSAQTASEGISGTALFASLFGGGGGGGAGAVLTFMVLGILVAFRLRPPDWDTALQSPAALWRPSAYSPPIEHPG